MKFYYLIYNKNWGEKSGLFPFYFFYKAINKVTINNRNVCNLKSTAWIIY